MTTAHGIGERGRIGLIAWSICALDLAIVIGAATLAFLNRASIHDPDQATAIAIILPIGFALLGALVVSRQPRNALGWIFLAISFCNGLPGLTNQYARLALLTNPGLPFSAWIPWVGKFTDNLVYPSGMALLAFLLLPAGRLISDRWRPVAWAGLAITAGIEVLRFLDPTGLDLTGVPHVPNPTGIVGLEGLAQGPIGIGLYVTGTALLLAGAASVLIRLRRATGEERLQLRWVASATIFAVLLNAVITALGLTLLSSQQLIIVITVTSVIGFGVALPASFAVAILRYRLYDLDLLLNRTILYGGVTVVLAAGLGIANLLAQRAVEAVFNQRSELVSAALGVGAAVTWGPMRSAARPLIDRALPARSRLTLLFTDIVQSTERLVDLGDEQWRDLLDRYRAAVRSELAHHRGREVNTAGDAFFAVFDRPMRGVECAVAMRSVVAELGLRVRTGLHCGEVEMRGEQVSGLAVHAAARVMAEADGDEILISRDVANELGGSVALRDAGAHALKGVPGEWQLFAVD